jgi:hypothetical protein
LVTVRFPHSSHRPGIIDEAASMLLRVESTSFQAP